MRKQLLTKMLLIAASLFVGTSAWADEIVLNSTQSAYVDLANSTTNYNGASVEKLLINNTQFRDWSSGSDGSVKFNSGGKVSLYKFDLTSLKGIGTITGVTFTVKGQTNDAGNKATSPVRVLGYNPTWDASTITQATLTNAGNKETLTGTVSGKGSFQPLNTTDGLTINATETTLNVNAITYVQSAIDADKDDVTIALAVNLGRTAYLETGAKLTVTYTTASAYNVTFSETNSVSATVKIDDTDVTSGTVLVNGNYSFTATATGYENYNGNFTVNGSDLNVSFTMTAKPTYSYTVYAKSGGTTLKTLTSGSYYKDDNVYYHYNQVLNYNGTLYQAAAISSGYKTSFVLDSDGKEVDHSYSQPATPVTNLVFLAEGEDVFTRGTGSSADTRCSMGAGGYATSKMEFVTLPAGEYYLVLSNRCSGDRTGIHKFYKGSDEEPFFSADGNGYNAERKSGLITLTEPTTLYFQGGDNNQYVDWLYVYGTPKVTIAAAGWATLFTPIALDFSGTGLTAYTATCDGTTVTLTPVENVPANTGVVLKGAANDYNIPVIASSSTAKGDLKGSATDAKAYDTDYNYYYLALNGSGNAQFKRLASGGSIAAGKAYLQLPYSAGARDLSVVFEDEATAISSVQQSQNMMQNECFDLQGRRVAQPTKGLYIVNGKKVVIK
jgi:hypothetical protein